MNKKKSFKIIIAVVALLAIAITAVVVLNPFGNKNEVNARTAIVYKLIDGTGTTILRGNENEKAYEGMRLLAGDDIVTDNNSQVYLRIDDDKNILLDKDSKISITELKDKSLLLTLIYGEFFFNVENKLSVDETMEFKIGSTSMSIRGTSGSGKLRDSSADLIIYTGAGQLSDTNNPNVTYKLMPNTKASFKVNGNNKSENTNLKTIKTDDVAPLLGYYTKENNKYAEELIEDGWTTTSQDDLVIPPEKVIDENDQDYSGWKENEDGSWDFVPEEYQQETPPIPYVEEETYPDKPTGLVDDRFNYDNTTHTVSVIGYNKETMTIENNSFKNVGRYVTTVSPKSKWSDGTTTSVKFNWAIAPIDVTTVYTGSTQNVEVDGLGNNCYVVGNSRKNAGSYSVSIKPNKAWQDGSTTQFSIDWTIKKAKLTIAENALPSDFIIKTYDGTTNVEYLIDNLKVTGLKGSDNPEVKAVGKTPNKNVGLYDDVSFSFNVDNDNYYCSTEAIETVFVGGIDITYSTDALEVEYDGTKVFTLTIPSSELVEVLPGEDVSFVAEIHTNSDAIGTYTVPGQANIFGHLSGTDIGNYNLIGVNASNVEITPRLLLINDLESLEVTYNRSQTFGITYGGTGRDRILEGESVSLFINCTTDSKNAGTHTANIQYQLFGDDSANYAIDPASNYTTELTVAPMELVLSVPTNQTKTYNGLKYKGTLSATAFTGTDDINIQYVATIPSKTAGNCTATITYEKTGADADNYSISKSSTSSIAMTINKKLIKMKNTQIYLYPYSDNNRNISIDFSDFDASQIVSGDDVGVIATFVISPGTATGNHTLACSYILTGDDNAVYEIDIANSANCVQISISYYGS